jgi:hypothetical protein
MFEWSDEKDLLLKKERGIGFQDILYHVQRGDLLLVAEHPNKEKYPAQRILYVRVDDYVYLVPYVESGDIKFLKTIIPSRQATKRLLKGGQQ